MNVLKLESKGRLFFVSDIHAELPTLLHGLKELGYDSEKDMCIHAGDMVDRGRHNIKTVEFLLGSKDKGIYTVLGNHDCFAFQNHKGDSDSAALWYINGGNWAFESMTQDERDTLAEKVKQLPYVIEVVHKGHKYGVVHASVPQDFKSWDDFIAGVEIGTSWLLQSCVWDREFVEYKQCKDFQVPLAGVRYTIHGHTPVKEPLLVGNRWHIDTGLVYGKYLTIAEVVDGELEFHKFELV